MDCVRLRGEGRRLRELAWALFLRIGNSSIGAHSSALNGQEVLPLYWNALGVQLPASLFEALARHYYENQVAVLRRGGWAAQ